MFLTILVSIKKRKRPADDGKPKLSKEERKRMKIEAMSVKPELDESSDGNDSVNCAIKCSQHYLMKLQAGEAKGPESRTPGTSRSPQASPNPKRRTSARRTTR